MIPQLGFDVGDHTAVQFLEAHEHTLDEEHTLPDNVNVLKGP